MVIASLVTGRGVFECYFGAIGPLMVSVLVIGRLSGLEGDKLLQSLTTSLVLNVHLT